MSDDETMVHNPSMHPLPSLSAQLAVDQDGLVHGGSLAALVGKLCQPWSTSENNPMSTGPEKTFQDVFLMTFRTFTTAEELLQMLIAQYHMKCPLSLSSELEDEWEQVQVQIQRRILTLFSMLWQGTTLTVTEKHSTMNTLMHFLLSIMEPPLMKTAQLIMVNVQGEKEKIESRMQEDSELVWPLPERPIDVEQDLSRFFLKALVGIGQLLATARKIAALTISGRKDHGSCLPHDMWLKCELDHSQT
ncbi:hypothetical protein B0H13DRAFT_2276935, partial [Mycena leptocephala]